MPRFPDFFFFDESHGKQWIRNEDERKNCETFVTHLNLVGEAACLVISEFLILPLTFR